MGGAVGLVIFPVAPHGEMVLAVRGSPICSGRARTTSPIAVRGVNGRHGHCVAGQSVAVDLEVLEDVGYRRRECRCLGWTASVR